MKGTTASRRLSVEAKSKKIVVHSAANENRKVLESRKNGEWNVKLGLNTNDFKELLFYGVSDAA